MEVSVSDLQPWSLQQKTSSYLAFYIDAREPRGLQTLLMFKNLRQAAMNYELITNNRRNSVQLWQHFLSYQHLKSWLPGYSLSTVSFSKAVFVSDFPPTPPPPSCNQNNPSEVPRWHSGVLTASLLQRLRVLPQGPAGLR